VAYHAVAARVGDMATPLFVGMVVLIMLLEWRVPADPALKRFDVSVLQDMVWCLIQAAAEATLVGAYAGLLVAVYHRWLEWPTLDLFAGLPTWLRLCIAVLIIDFLRYAYHLVQHKVPWFWQFHAVHHSQRHLNLFTDFRYHPFDYVVRETVFFVPMLLLGIPWPGIVWLRLLLLWHARFYHGNIRWNLGFLRYIIVTPQSHRVHHSVEDAHQDRNFGAFLSVWDWLFGTQYHSGDDYPQTGIADAEFPHEVSAAGLNLIITPLRQLLYPFVAIGRSLLSRVDAAARQPVLPDG